jgi:hypothetical protein
MLSPSDAARPLKLPVQREIPAYVLAGQSLVLVDDLVAGRVLTAIEGASK